MAGYKKSNLCQDMRKPVIMLLLRKLSTFVTFVFFQFEAALLQSVFTLAFIALLPVGEVVALGIEHVAVSRDAI